MGTVSIVKNIFNTGELSPKIYTRTDIDKHKGGCKTLLNFVPLPQGGVQRRPGFEYISTAKNSNAAIRLIPFQFSTDQAYIIAAQNGTLQFYAGGAKILDANNNAYTLNTTYTAAELSSLQWTQSYDTLFVTHKAHVPAQITRTANNAWTIGNVSFNNAPAEWSANNGYPRTCAFYQDRLCFASSTLFPSRLWLSNVGSYANMTTGTNDSDGMTLNLLSGTSDVIFWMASGKSLVAGADSGVWQIAAATGATSAISPTNKKADKISYFGASEVMPAKLGDIIIHPGYPASKIRELTYDFGDDGYKSGELSVLSDHIFDSKTITELAYQQNPFEIVWCRLSDGTVAALTYMQEHKVVAWSRHTSGTIKSMAAIPGTYETELWAAIERTVSGNNYTYIERLAGFVSKTFNNSDFMDSHILATGSNMTSMAVSHLNGSVVQYVAGGVVGNATVTTNNITIPTCNAARAGLAYVSDLETMPVSPELKSGETMFNTKRITEIQVRCRNSAGGSYGPDSSYLAPLFNNNAFTNGHVVNLSRREGNNSAETEKTVFIRQSDPLPMNIDAIGMEVEV